MFPMTQWEWCEGLWDELNSPLSTSLWGKYSMQFIEIKYSRIHTGVYLMRVENCTNSAGSPLMLMLRSVTLVRIQYRISESNLWYRKLIPEIRKFWMKNVRQDVGISLCCLSVFVYFSLWYFVVWVGPCLMEDEERQNALKPWKEKIGGLECKARRRTLDKVYTSLQDRDDDDDEYEQWLPVVPRKLRSFSWSKGVKSGEVDISIWWLHALAITKYDDLWESLGIRKEAGSLS